MNKRHNTFMVALCMLICGCGSFAQQGVAEVQGPEGGILVKYDGFTVSYNPEHRIPNWVLYELTSDETYGQTQRNGKYFRPDESLWAKQADDYDYRNSGWTRGHMAPAGDFKWSDDAMWDTFLFTNCCPQDEDLNGGQWNTLEKKVRDWARKYGSVTVVTGPIIGENIYGTIGRNKVTVPDAFFKAVLAGDEAIAFVMYNRSSNANMQRCAISIDDLEELTGIDFFTNLEDNAEAEIEADYSLRHWGL